MEEILYTVPEVSKLLKVNTNCVYDLIRSGLLPCMKLGRLKIRRKAILEFVDKYEGKDLSNPKEVKELNHDELV